MTLNGHFTLNSVAFVNSSSKFAYLFIWTAPLYLWWDHRKTHLCVLEVCKLFQCRRLTSSMSSI